MYFSFGKMSIINILFQNLFQTTGNTFSDQINKIKSWYLSKIYIIYTKIGPKVSFEMTKMVSL